MNDQTRGTTKSNNTKDPHKIPPSYRYLSLVLFISAFGIIFSTISGYNQFYLKKLTIINLSVSVSILLIMTYLDYEEGDYYKIRNFLFNGMGKIRGFFHRLGSYLPKKEPKKTSSKPPAWLIRIAMAVLLISFIASYWYNEYSGFYFSSLIVALIFLKDIYIDYTFTTTVDSTPVNATEKWFADLMGFIHLVLMIFFFFWIPVEDKIKGTELKLMSRSTVHEIEENLNINFQECPDNKVFLTLCSTVKGDVKLKATFQDGVLKDFTPKE